MTAEPDSARRSRGLVGSGTTACLHVVDGQRDWLLPADQIGAVYKAPEVQPIPTQSVLSGLVVHRRSVYGALRLSRIWTPTVTSSARAAFWGLVFGRGAGELVFLVEDVVGNIDVDHEEIEWSEGHSDEPLLGVRVLDDRPQLLVDPMRSPLLRDLSGAEDEHPWLEVRSLSEAVETDASPPEVREQVVVIEDSGSLFAVPAKSVFEVGRPVRGDAPRPPRLKQLMADTRPDEENGASPVFCCRIGGPTGSVEVCFDELLTWHSVAASTLSTWPRMDTLSLLGAFSLAGQSRAVMLLDPSRILQKQAKCKTFRPPAEQRPQMSKGAQPMPGDLSGTLILRANQRQAALSMSSIRNLSSWRRAQIYPAGVSHRAIVGIFERAGQFSIVVDLGTLLDGGAVRPGPDSRLITVDTASGLITLLADSVSEPFEVRAAIQTPHAQDRLFAGTIPVEGGADVPILDPAAIVAAVGEQADD